MSRGISIVLAVCVFGDVTVEAQVSDTAKVKSKGGAKANEGTRAASPRSSASREPGSSPAEEARYLARANRLRDRIMSRTSWTDLDEGPCPAGWLRTFTPDSGQDKNQAAIADVEMLERIIIARGVDSTLNSAAALGVFRTVIGWEVAGVRPLWDDRKGEKARRAIAAGLTGQFRNPETGKCESFVAFDSAIVILPDGVRLAAVKFPRVSVDLYNGEAGLRKARDKFYAAAGHDANSVFTYVRIRAAVVWKNFAVIGVNRPAEQRGIVELPKGAGGAAYIFHRLNGEWRLLAITRTWA
ncbi:MAG: hypothetical protein ABR543_14480 [Gemmatimonadaceae bacterium]